MSLFAYIYILKMIKDSKMEKKLSCDAVLHFILNSKITKTAKSFLHKITHTK